MVGVLCNKRAETIQRETPPIHGPALIKGQIRLRCEYKRVIYPDSRILVCCLLLLKMGIFSIGHLAALEVIFPPRYLSVVDNQLKAWIHITI